MEGTLIRATEYVCCIIITLGIASCVNNRKSINNVEKKRVNTINSYAESCSELYLKAINDVKSGQDTEIVKEKYKWTIDSFHNELSNIFDSITSDYLHKKISPSEYASLQGLIHFKTVEKRSEELTKLGIKIQ